GARRRLRGPHRPRTKGTACANRLCGRRPDAALLAALSPKLHRAPIRTARSMLSARPADLPHLSPLAFLPIRRAARGYLNCFTKRPPLRSYSLRTILAPGAGASPPAGGPPPTTRRTHAPPPPSPHC